MAPALLAMPELKSQVRTQVWSGAETHLSVHCGVSAVRCVQTIDQYKAMKTTALQLLTTTWVWLTNIILKKRSLTQNNNFYIVLLITFKQWVKSKYNF